MCKIQSRTWRWRHHIQSQAMSFKLFLESSVRPRECRIMDYINWGVYPRNFCANHTRLLRLVCSKLIVFENFIRRISSRRNWLFTELRRFTNTYSNLWINETLGINTCSLLICWAIAIRMLHINITITKIRLAKHLYINRGSWDSLHASLLSKQRFFITLYYHRDLTNSELRSRSIFISYTLFDIKCLRAIDCPSGTLVVFKQKCLFSSLREVQ